MHVGVFGAGAIGCFMGIRLSAAGTRVTLVGRPALVEAAGRLAAVSLSGARVVPGDDLCVTSDPAALRSVDLCLVTVKSRDTDDAGRTLATVLSPSATVVSLQNGLSNPRTLRAHLGDRVGAGMVSYNVFRDDDGSYRQATSGPLVVERGRGDTAAAVDALRSAFAAASEPLELHDDMESVAAGKLLLNLNNGICAATGLTIAESLRSRDARWCFAVCMREGLRVLAVTGPKPATVVKFPPSMLWRLLMLPNFIVTRFARKIVAVDPQARSSTLQDVLAGRTTEIDELNGAIVSLAEQAGLSAPGNATVTRRVHALHGHMPPPFATAAQLRAEIQHAAAATTT